MNALLGAAFIAVLALAIAAQMRHSRWFGVPAILVGAAADFMQWRYAPSAYVEILFGIAFVLLSIAVTIEARYRLKMRNPVGAKRGPSGR